MYNHTGPVSKMISDFQDDAWYMKNISNALGKEWFQVAASLNIKDAEVSL